MSDYTQAPATKILATHCCACGLPLLRADSVELGIGPDCRRKYMGRSQGFSDEARAEANQIVYRLALAISGASGRTIGAELAVTGEGGVACLSRLRELGFVKLADKLEKAWVTIRIEEAAGTLKVHTPFLDEAVAAARAIPGRSWDGANKCNIYPASQRPAVWSMLCKYHPGTAGVGPRGLFVVPTTASSQASEASRAA